MWRINHYIVEHGPRSLALGNPFTFVAHRLPESAAFRAGYLRRCFHGLLFSLFSRGLRRRCISFLHVHIICVTDLDPCSHCLGVCHVARIAWAHVLIGSNGCFCTMVGPSDCIYTMPTLLRRLYWSTVLNTFETCPNCLGRLYGQALSPVQHWATLFWLNDVIGHGRLCISNAHTFCAQVVVRLRILL